MGVGGAEQRPDLAGVSGHETDRVEGVCIGDDAPAGNEAVGGLETVDGGVGGREADGAACVGCEGAFATDIRSRAVRTGKGRW